jgi:protein TonB
MEAAMGTVRKTERPPAGFGFPLIVSAAGHLALLGGILLWGAAAGQNFLDAVQVVLVEGAAVSSRAKGPDTAAPAGKTVRAAGIRPRAARNVPPAPAEGNGDASHREATGRGPSTEAPAAPSPEYGNRQAEGDSAAASGGMLSAELESWPRGGGSPGGGHAEGASAAAALPASAGAGSGGGRDGAAIRRLRERIESRIVYPEEAIRRGQEGEVLLRIRVGEGGIPKEIRVARSSGARTLDEAARTGVSRAAPLPSTPGWFEVPIRFSLR